MKILGGMKDNSIFQWIATRQIGRWLLLLFTVTSITLVMSPLLSYLIDVQVVDYTPGEVATHTIRASRDFTIEDEVGTERLRAEAVSQVPRVFTKVASVKKELPEELGAFFALIRESASKQGEGNELFLPPAKRETLERQFRVDFVGSEWEIVSQPSRWPEIERSVLSLINPLYLRGIVHSKKTVRRVVGNASAVLRAKESGKEEVFDPLKRLFELSDVRELIEGAFTGSRGRDKRAFDSVVRKLARAIVKPSVFYDADETAKREFAVRQSIQPVFFTVKRGQVLVRAGDVITQVHQRRLKQLRGSEEVNDLARSFVGYLVLVGAIICGTYSFVFYFWPAFRLETRDLLVLSATLIVSSLLVRLFDVLGGAITLSVPYVDTSKLVLAAPFATGAILLQVTLGASAVFIFMMAFAALAGLFLSDPLLVVLLILVGNIVGAISVKSCSRRTAFIRAGARVSLINILLIFCYLLVFPDYSSTNAASRILWGLAGGLLSGILAAGISPILEYLGHYVTDMKLLELASLDRPLLRELSVQAPGTWNHSMVLGQMGEAAAEATGANSLLTRVGAYYHDIGKSKKPLYFVENQSGKDNRHDKLAPSMSALIIKAHVKDGIEMAKQHRLPQAIIDLIQQHHGTSLIQFFYDKAMKEAEEESSVNDSHFRYSGPKPQTKEAGILMLADAVEASSRTLSDPTHAKIQGLVQKLINKIFTSGELDESNLTLRDLHLIAKSFTRVLTGIYHHRVEYSESAEKGRDSKKEKGKGAEGASGARLQTISEKAEKDGSGHSGSGDGKGSTKKDNGKKGASEESDEALKRLGMS